MSASSRAPRPSLLPHKFVEFIPDKPEAGVLYVSLAYNIAVHRCACGCGREVVTPLSPKDWKLIFDGETVSLHPSIGNWNFPCRSHYWIREGHVVWVHDEPKAGRRRSLAAYVRDLGRRWLTHE